MLPRSLYEFLPYIYIFVGILSAVTIDSTVVLISSLLLIAAGAVVLISRRQYRLSMIATKQMFEAMDEPLAENVREGFILRSGIDRRRQVVTEWPTYDHAGSKIFSDRRVAERRVSMV